MAPFCVSRKPLEVTLPSTVAAGHGWLLKSQLVKMKLLKKSAPQLALFRAPSGLVARKSPRPSPHLRGHPGPVLAARDSAPSLSPREAPDLLGAEGPEAPSPRVGTWPLETAERRALGPPRPPALSSLQEEVQPGRGQGGRGGSQGALHVHFPAFLERGACLFITPMPTSSPTFAQEG